jgi:1-acyl-sn-glycerol-3-phosphate acyltransferase
MLDLPRSTAATAHDTPDVLRVPFGFDSEHASDRFRTQAGAWGLTAASLRAATALHPRLSRRANHRLARAWAKTAAQALGMKFSINGSEHIDPGRQYLVMPLHEGFVDIPTLLHLPLDLRFTVREELLSMPHIGRYIAISRQILVPDSPSVTNYKAMYSEIATAVTSGDSIVVFPQGSVLGIDVAFRPGVARIARRFGLPVLPVVISGTHRVWEYPFARTVRLGQDVSVTVLPAIDPSNVSMKAIRSAEREMKATALNNPVAPARRFVPRRDGWWDDHAFEIDDDFAELQHRVASRRTL